MNPTFPSEPYPGHTWIFTQHAIGLNPQNLYHLLYAAYTNSGKVSPRTEINRYLADHGVLTENIRAGRGADAWRDYQQIAAELGLIYSTKLVPELRLTTIGIQYVDQGLSYKETLTAQALKYQYPNGHKSDISTRLRREMQSKGVSIPESLIDLQSRSGVLLKPAVLILRLLIELTKEGLDDAISVDECQKTCLPIARNLDWRAAFDALEDSRRGTGTQLPLSGVRRNVQDWFSFLYKTSVFEMRTNGRQDRLGLSQGIKGELAEAERMCAEQERPDSFWAPDSTLEGRIGWFDFYGSINLYADFVEPETSITPEYISENYVVGREEPEEGISDFLSQTPAGISEVPFVPGGPPPASGANTTPSIAAIRAGIEKRKDRTRLHEMIVGEIAQQCKMIGAEVFEDPSSTDLVIKMGGLEVIVEVKTVTRRNFSHRIRLGIGQLLEYQYRRRLQTQNKPSIVLAISTMLPEQVWLLDFLNADLDIGLLCRNGRKYKVYSHNQAVKNLLTFQNQWL